MGHIDDGIAFQNAQAEIIEVDEFHISPLANLIAA
jgi:hypothetical protein